MNSAKRKRMLDALPFNCPCGWQVDGKDSDGHPCPDCAKGYVSCHGCGGTVTVDREGRILVECEENA